MFGIFRKSLKIKPITSMQDLEDRVAELGFLPMFRSVVPNFSVYENTPGFWTGDDGGPWEWKGPMIREGHVAYGKFFNRKAGYVSLQWLPHFLNYRRTKHLAPDEDAAAMDDIVLQTVHAERQVTIQELRQLLGLSRKKRKAGDFVVEEQEPIKVNLDTNLTRLMMEGRVCIADFGYNVDKKGRRYGWGIARYTTPELLYGPIIATDCTPEESYEAMLKHLKSILRGTPESKIKKLLG